jgi:hypothetical protein
MRPPLKLVVFVALSVYTWRVGLAFETQCEVAHPTFLIIGASRSGVKDLFRRLVQFYPHVFIRPCGRGGPKMSDSTFDRAAYEQCVTAGHGSEGKTGSFTVDVSPKYFHDTRAAERAASLNPNATVLVLLREPIARVKSMFNMGQFYHAGNLSSILKTELAAFSEPGPFRTLTESLQGTRPSTVDVERANNIISISNSAVEDPAYSAVRELMKTEDGNLLSLLLDSIYYPFVKSWRAALPGANFLAVNAAAYYEDPFNIIDTFIIPELFSRSFKCKSVLPPPSLVKDPVKFTSSHGGHDYGQSSLSDEVQGMLRQFYTPFNRALFELLNFPDVVKVYPGVPGRNAYWWAT